MPFHPSLQALGPRDKIGRRVRGHSSFPAMPPDSRGLSPSPSTYLPRPFSTAHCPSSHSLSEVEPHSPGREKGQLQSKDRNPRSSSGPHCSPAPGPLHRTLPGGALGANCSHLALDTWAVPICHPSAISHACPEKLIFWDMNSEQKKMF